NVIDQFRELERGNYVCQVWDEDKDNNRTISLVNKHFRNETPGFYFLAVYKKEDILAINGWDEDFMGGCGWEDNDFGERFVRADLPFEIRDEIEGQHQYHFRWYTDLQRNMELYEKNKANNVVRCVNGISKLEKEV
ncbi:MAG: galactosyltransferase-related protein, partial [Promethearchaeota archaeon]